MGPYKVLVIEDHVLVRQALIGALNPLAPDISFVEASCAKEALASLESARDVDLVLTDLMLPDMSGFSLLSVLSGRFPDLPVIVVSAADDDASIQRALRTGAMGFLSKTVSTAELLSSLRTVLEGGVLPTNRLGKGSGKHARGKTTDSVAERYGLTAAQVRVLELMIEGRTNREIAGLLGLAEGTVKIHCSAILKALGVSSRAQALVYLARNGYRV